MTTGQKGLTLIKFYESLKLQAYKCPAGIWTIGYGHTGNVCVGDHITIEMALSLLAQDLKVQEDTINKLNLPLSQNKFDALVSFVFNCGTGNFANSTLKKKVVINSEDPAIKDEFMKWTRGGGIVLPGLVKRRNEEQILYFTE